MLTVDLRDGSLLPSPLFPSLTFSNAGTGPALLQSQAERLVPVGVNIFSRRHPGRNGKMSQHMPTITPIQDDEHRRGLRHRVGLGTHISTFPHFPISTFPRFHDSTFPRFHVSTFPYFRISTFPHFHISTFPHFHISTFPVIRSIDPN